MKTIKPFFLVAVLLVGIPCCFGQTDTNLLAAGDWSAPVTITDANWPLRGRLLVYDAEKGNGKDWPHGRIYLELQNVQRQGGPPAEFYFDKDKSCLHFEMRDGHGNLIPLGMSGYWGFMPEPFTFILPAEGTIRVRVDFESTTSPEPVGLLLHVGPGRGWVIRPDSTNDYYLSAIFSPPTNRPSILNDYVWHGTLNLPKVKIPIPVKKP